MYDVFTKFRKKLNLKKQRNDQILMTIHRKTNIENISKMKKIIWLANQITKLGYEVIFPIHPHTRKQLQSFHISLNKINTMEPVNYSKMLTLLGESKMMITDSGGLQKEAYWMNTPCVTIRKSTEWIETLENNNILLDIITSSTMRKIKKIISQKIPQNKRFEFGNGQSAKKWSQFFETTFRYRFFSFSSIKSPLISFTVLIPSFIILFLRDSFERISLIAF